MSTLFQALISQHARTLKPLRDAEPMTTQLQNFFEEVVLENSLQALVIESLPLRPHRSLREVERVRRISNTARYPYFLVSPEDELNYWIKTRSDDTGNNSVLLPRGDDEPSNEQFVVIADAQFSALLTSIYQPNDQRGAHQVIYTFDPDVIYTALEYLQARITAQHPAHAENLLEAIHRSMPKTTSLHLTLAVTNKLASLWQEQTGREIAVNRIATAIRQSLELDQVLQTAVNEVGAALDVECSLLIESEGDEQQSLIYSRDDLPPVESDTLHSDLEAYRARLRNNPQTQVRDGYSGNHQNLWQDNPQIVVPVSFLDQFVGVFFVQAADRARTWQESEILLLQTVADQVAIAIKHARLYVKSQQEALRDGLTGVSNRRYFDLQFDRECKNAQRKGSTFALVMIDIDHFKAVNDNYGHHVGDRVLRHTAQLLRDELRTLDTLTRYGGEEFAIILPNANRENARLVAERLRSSLCTIDAPDVQKITASFGVAVYPNDADTPAELLKAADKALYHAKRTGRNRVCLAAETDDAETENHANYAFLQVTAPQ